MHILLMGPRACGKTEVGRRLAAAVGLPFVDLDDVALARFDESSVSAVWTEHGEAAWRAAETLAFEQTLERQDAVIALGGGTPMIPVARDRIERVRQTGGAVTVYLQCPVGVLAQRLRADAGDRPSLTGEEVAEEIQAVLREREPTYSRLADTVVDASCAPNEVVEELARWVRSGPK